MIRNQLIEGLNAYPMMGPIAQATPNSLLVAIIFITVSLPIGLLMGYLAGYRYKRHYVRVAKELANLKGENFRGELTKVGMPQGPAARTVPLPSGADKLERAHEIEQGLREELAQRTAERDQLAAELAATRDQVNRLHATWNETSSSVNTPPAASADRLTDGAAKAGGNGHLGTTAGVSSDSSSASTSVASGTEAWQLAQLHREQIAMQLRLDNYLEQIHQLSEQRDQWQQQVATESQEFQHLRQLLAEQEALIASVERQRDSLAARVSELELR